MANPQLQNGYTRIANELLEAICRLNISGNELRILLFIVRRTYGFNKSSTNISLTEISEATGVRKNHVSRALKKLSDLKIIKRQTFSGTKSQSISIVKNYEEWTVENCTELPLPKMVTVTKNGNPTVTKNGNPTVTKNGNPTVTKNGNPTYKENIKENIKDKEKESYSLKPYGHFKNVLLTNDEYEQLIYDYGEQDTERYIDKVDNWVELKGKEKADYCATIRSWMEKDGVEKWNHKYDFVINNI